MRVRFKARVLTAAYKPLDGPAAATTLLFFALRSPKLSFPPFIRFEVVLGCRKACQVILQIGTHLHYIMSVSPPFFFLLYERSSSFPFCSHRCYSRLTGLLHPSPLLLFTTKDPKTLARPLGIDPLSVRG